MIPIYKSEKEAGLADLISSKASISFSALLEKSDYAPSPAKIKELTRAIATNDNQIDLYALKAILVSVGWNLNDEVFDRTECWIARNTAEDKPFNMEHNPRVVIGHITSNYVVDDGLKLVPDTSSIDDLPEKYHIVSNAVIYKFLASKDPTLESEMKQLIAEIENGDWHVSMEALFTNFDYAVIDASGKKSIIARNEDSAFLTKHLRAYGGKGVYNDYKIGRLPRNITFSGKGLVKNPANPESIIFKNVASFSAKASSIEKEFSQLKTASGYTTLSNEDLNKGSDRMPDVNNTQVDVLSAQLKSVESTLAATQKKNDELEKRLTEVNEKQVQAKVADLEGQIKSKDEKVTSLQAQVKAEQDARLAAEAKVTDLEKKNVQLETEVNTVKAEKAQAGRVAQWIERTGVETAVATKAVQNLTKLSDDEFKNFLDTQPAKASTTVTTDTNKNTSGSANANTAVLENAQAKNNTPPVNSGVDNVVESTRAGLAKFIGETYLGKKNKSKANTAK